LARYPGYCLSVVVSCVRFVSAIVETFRKPGYTDDKDGKEVARLVGEMQDLGGPPSEWRGGHGESARSVALHDCTTVFVTAQSIM
jgi:hypothetical protein